ncbi:hypothetical protein Goshw_003939 [Gossypium schwendimanii]|uniref:Uncharacterized protein n=1 Tax=Gossypium schwendimanii TaxID=34291 RepID=A0A7J9LDX2_GOSSC|nr:hypothetical protein [Gossypium schwendimanii]
MVRLGLTRVLQQLEVL